MNDTSENVRRFVLLLGVLAALIGAAWAGHLITRWWADRPMRQFNEQVDTLFDMLHKYKQYVGEYPRGNNADVVRALTGNNSKKVILILKPTDLSSKGELVDPWGTPLRLYFTDTDVLIRSAGPNRRFDDSRTAPCDDYFRSD